MDRTWFIYVLSAKGQDFYVGGHTEQVEITAIVDTSIYYRPLDGGRECVVSASEFKESIVDLSKIRTEISL